MVTINNREPQSSLDFDNQSHHHTQSSWYEVWSLAHLSQPLPPTRQAVLRLQHLDL